MDNSVVYLHQTLQRLVGLHRQLLETVRLEKEALRNSDLKNIQDATLAKEGIIEQVRQQELERQKTTATLSIAWKKPVRDLTLPNIIIVVQGFDQKLAEQLRSTFNALTILIQRITEQNRENLVFVERSLEHVHNMKKNILGETVPRSNTYTQNGQRQNTQSGARFVSKEA